MTTTTLQHKTVSADGIEIFYRSAGSPTNPTLLLLHGFPSSSHHFRHLIPLLSESYHIIAPDLPGFGFTTVPTSRSYDYTFANLTLTIEAFLSVLNIQQYSVFIFDYGAPVALRLALRNPASIQAIISQNGNAYIEGLGADFWAPIQKYWASGSTTDREALIPLALSFEATKWQYEFGTPASHLSNIDPASYHLDYALLSRAGNEKIQLDLFKDYGENVKLYPQFQEYFRMTQIPLLAVWGKHDLIFVKEGAEAFKRDLPGAEVHLLDAGHFVTESHAVELAGFVKEFLGRFVGVERNLDSWARYKG